MMAFANFIDVTIQQEDEDYNNKIWALDSGELNWVRQKYNFNGIWLA